MTITDLVWFQNGFLEQFDIDALVEKIRVYCGIDKGSKQYNHILDVHKAFYECLKDQVAQEKGKQKKV